jgi:hypothetical protein
VANSPRIRLSHRGSPVQFACAGERMLATIAV